MRKAVECDMEALKGKDWLALELVRGLSYTILQKWLLQEQDTVTPAGPHRRTMVGGKQRTDSFWKRILGICTPGLGI